MENITVKARIRVTAGQAWRSFTQPAHVVHWNFAHESWHCPTAENELRVGGRFKYHMAARDGSAGFDFSGTFEAVEHQRGLDYVLDDGRKAQFRIEEQGEEVLVTHRFEAESANPLELQAQGWQAILDQYAQYTTGLVAPIRMQFERQLTASRERVFRSLFEKPSYEQWTRAFNAHSTYEGEWELGAKILFLGRDERGEIGGMVSRLRVYDPYQSVCLEHCGEYKHGQEVLLGPSVVGWAGHEENYFLEAVPGGTLLRVEVDVDAGFTDWMNEHWPLALDALAGILEE